ncbi:MAG: hypothetical protein JWN75_607 [Candidatus Saccharibacteria bacterium]|nr:hypothetical protein [Candidatus Saccharibacteria bacterium]
MSVTIIYKDSSEYRRSVTEFLRDFERQTGEKVATLDPDTRQGAEYCRLYDIVEYPSVVATASSGEMRNLWRGLPLPTINEVSYYV